jgi:hypothetical protein
MVHPQLVVAVGGYGGKWLVKNKHTFLRQCRQRAVSGVPRQHGSGMGGAEDGDEKTPQHA